MNARIFPIDCPRGENEPVRMVLFVAGDEVNSQKARANLEHVCSEHLGGHCATEIVDVLVDHTKALEWKVLLTPALLVLGSGKPLRITGSLDDTERVLAALALRRGQSV